MAGRIPQEFLDQLLSRVDLTEVVDTRVSLRKAGREYLACCPFHTERTASFTVSPQKQFYHCFGCGAHGNAIGFLMDYEHLSFVDAVEELARSAGLELPRGTHRPEQDDHGDLLALAEHADHFFRRQLREHPACGKAIDYLRGRGLTGEIVKAFGIGYAPPGWDTLLRALAGDEPAARKGLVAAGLAVETDSGGYHDRFRDRIMFPIRDRRGRTLGFGGRALGDATPKYLNSPETPLFHKGQELYGLFEARTSVRHLQRLLVVEGYMDVVALAQHELRYVVATLGTATTTAHLERLFRLSRDVVFCFDGDRAGREAAWRALDSTLPLLRDGRQASFLFLPEGEDPDSLVRREGREGFERRLDQALPLSDYFFDHLSAAVDLTRLDGRARLVEQGRPLLERLPDGIFRDMMNQRLADTARVADTRLRSPAATTTMQPRKREAGLTRTPLRKAIGLLLNRTALARTAGDIGRFHGITEPGMPLLVELIELMQSEPHINTAGVLERYRGTDAGRILERLAQWRPEIADELFEAEFLEALGQLEKRHSIERRLLDKLVQGELSPEETEILRNLGKAQRVKV